MLLGVPAERLTGLDDRQASGDIAAATETEAIFKAATFKRWFLNLRSNIDEFGGSRRVGSVVSACVPAHLSKHEMKGILEEVRESCERAACNAGGA